MCVYLCVCMYEKVQSHTQRHKHPHTHTHLLGNRDVLVIILPHSCLCVCVCLRKEEGVGNGVCQLSHRLEAKCSTKCIIMVCNHWSHPVSINFDYPISWCYLLNNFKIVCMYYICYVNHLYCSEISEAKSMGYCILGGIMPCDF